MLSFDQQMNLVNRGLAVMKNDGKFTTFKYHRRAMYDYLWFDTPELMECRGHVYDSDTHELVQAAPRKSFNYLENDTWWKDMDPNTLVKMYKKINGYMACATLHNGELLVSTTGSTTSEYAQWAKELILKDYGTWDLTINEDSSALFEVVVPQDPHIVSERMGLHLLGTREKISGFWWPLGYSPIVTLKTAISMAESDRGEGFMLYPYGDYSTCCKLKTPYYVGKKKLMRMSAKNVEIMYKTPHVTQEQLPNMWRDVPDRILLQYTKEQWLSFNDQSRRLILESLKG